MFDRDEVIRQAAACAEAHGGEIRVVLRAYLSAATPADLRFEEQRLRSALVAQAAGYESSAHDGATYPARQLAARHALIAWDGPVEELATIHLGAVRVRGSRDLIRRLGWSIYPDIDTGALIVQEQSHAADGELAQALSEGLDGDRAMLRALALRTERRAAVDADRRKAEIAHEESKAAGMTLAAARENNKPRTR